ncbi:MAG TPA: EAL domain-containing protein [Solirubrobacteraceae bacterium]|jgi:diguanylate cyclase (GGDEF)-like protein/PAS domain S-box-containing protein|nr:EAL domain-containing protein [Solirubrobacteraceae bacterium]
MTGRPYEQLRGVSERLLTEAEQAASAGSFELELGTGGTRFSAGLRRIFATPPDVELTRELLLARVHPGDRELVEKSFERGRHGKEPLQVDFRITRFDGGERVVRARGEAIVEGKGGPVKVVGTMQDVTEEAAAREARDLLSYVVDSTGDAIVTKAHDGTITSWNRGAEQLYGYSAAEAIGQQIALIEPASRAGEQERIIETLVSGESIDNFETEGMRKDGSVITVSLTVSPVTDANGRIVSTAIIARDSTERVRYEERLRHMADHDQLTGLLNRRRFDEQLKRELARAGRYASHSAVLSIDIDNFKGTNDSAGHAAGDAVLVQVASVLSSRFRSTDVVARLGGDEFAVLLSAVGADEARAAAEDLLSEIRNSPASYGGRPFRISASIGVVAFESDDATAGEVLVNADLAMYAAKTAGRDRVVVYTAPEARKARAMAKLSWSQRIQDALDRDRFVLHLQPILELATGQIKHGELLLRMKGERGKLIAPGAFLPAAERFGLIHAIDRWVVSRAIQLIAESMGPVPRVGINLSGESVVGDPELLRMIEHELERSSVDPSKLIFEVTETAAIANMPEATQFARGLTDLGCSLALDDFGTGFGSFYYLKHLPVSYVKLDGEFVQNLPRSEVDEHMVKAIVGVSQALGIKTVAESVADAETISLLQKHQVDYAQGYYVGKPTPLSVALADGGWLSANPAVSAQGPPL